MYTKASAGLAWTGVSALTQSLIWAAVGAVVIGVVLIVLAWRRKRRDRRDVSA